ncbi:NAD-dependent epimerase/dehydratase family protein [bacterium]|nr:NAD-dependent epimerase/dehydratase family protein [bacterium]
MENDKEKFHVISDLIYNANKSKEINLLTDGLEERQFLHTEDCSECLLILSELYDNIPRDKNYHVTSFHWTKILDIAKLVAKYFGIKNVKKSQIKDNVQLGMKNEPDPYIFKYWKPKISIEEGVNNIIEEILNNEK